jgi:predicted ATP-grasp superfamily ATP-dependent carboligase
MYTGGLENHPDVIAAISQTRRLWGNGPDELPNARDPFRLFATFTAKGIACPLVCPIAGPQPAGRRWLAKRVSSGGRGIAEFDYSSEPRATGDYLQEFIPGEPLSSLYLSMPWRVYFLGLATQLVGTPWLHAQPFQYAGNVAPVGPTEFEHEVAKGVGVVVTQAALKFGYFGIDFIRTETGLLPIEVNPRYTASVEVYELASCTASLRWHMACATCVDADPDAPWVEPAEFTATRVVGKAIYYAAAPITFPASGPWDESLRHCTDVWRVPEFADIPHAGSVVEPGQPVFTLFAAAATEAECVKQLKARAAACDRLFGVPTPSEDRP